MTTYQIIDSHTGNVVATAKTRAGASRGADRRDSAYGAVRYIVKPIYKDDPNRSHMIVLGSDSTITCYEHSNDSVLELVKRYYEGKYKFSAVVLDNKDNVIYFSGE